MLSKTTSCEWQAAQIGDALYELAQSSGLTRKIDNHRLSPFVADYSGQVLDEWIHETCASMDVVAKGSDVKDSEIEAHLNNCAPALIQTLGNNGPVFYAVLEQRGRTLKLLCPGHQIRRIRINEFCAILRRPYEKTEESRIDRIIQASEIKGRWQVRSKNSLLRTKLGQVSLARVWKLRPDPSTSPTFGMRRGQMLGMTLGFRVAEYIVILGAWWLFGSLAFSDRWESGWIMAWAGLLLTAMPLRLFAEWMQGQFAIEMGLWLKRKLLVGALRLPADELRQAGMGHRLGQILESSAIESLALSGGFLLGLAMIEFTIALVLFGVISRNLWLASGLGIWLGLAMISGWLYYLRQREWTDHRLLMTHELVERLVGHRTRLAQESVRDWHVEEDQVLRRSLALGRRLDHASVRMAVGARGSMILGFCGLTPAAFTGDTSMADVALNIGGILLFMKGLQKFTAGIPPLCRAVIAWQQIAPLIRAAETPEQIGASEVVCMSREKEDQSKRDAKNLPILDAHRIVYCFSDRGEPVLSGCDLSIWSGDRILLEGESGGGKSTLAAILAGLRRPQAGLLWLSGLDYPSLGAAGWRRRVAAAPQYHDNHLMTAPLAFNLLMGRSWPPTQKDLEDAAQICQELGLGPLLERMPGGLWQMVGETGWQLSQGEQSRVYMARALLQDADLVILDESFGALDPETMKQSMRCVISRARSLLVVAHP